MTHTCNTLIPVSMELQDWIEETKGNAHYYAVTWGMSWQTLKNIIDKRADVRYDTAEFICAQTGGKVSIAELRLYKPVRRDTRAVQPAPAAPVVAVPPPAPAAQPAQATRRRRQPQAQPQPVVSVAVAAQPPAPALAPPATRRRARPGAALTTITRPNTKVVTHG